ncbi:hypothetical protein HRR83_007795 [Exophiala dermatitidis]|uniref:Secreted protein n=1 Tax=Exophiala dermatitidis TaxID=5970 RepID=A0AAN6EV78_EXODE|nr:hypothetical protein HRR74_007548 [Exophiala dermatitidis]KAJ4510208.1 hypothetical protein HRR73_007006 [Exophiala dermatitidis]KAJ4539216.1 hypothetical protein HRR77_006627 [Exophiala dermatitidis]KAJ4540503.1 hypothetical protein HRR76_003894 [Exophiala dermatitidis]KAJ4564664.1 hypothetical protein HRR79_005918 [Exophiala dermatitidis]
MVLVTVFVFTIIISSSSSSNSTSTNTDTNTGKHYTSIFVHFIQHSGSDLQSSRYVARRSGHLLNLVRRANVWFLCIYLSRVNRNIDRWKKHLLCLEIEVNRGQSRSKRLVVSSLWL